MTNTTIFFATNRNPIDVDNLVRQDILAALKGIREDKIAGRHCVASSNTYVLGG
jgi:hypothetical protein